MEIDAESLRIRYEQMETEELVELYRRGSLTELAFGVLDQALHERGVASSVIQPKLGHPSCLCNAKLVEDGHKLGLIMSNARLRELLANWRDRRADAVTALLIAACGYAAIAAAGVMFIGYVDSKLVQIVVALFVAASGFAAAMRLFSVVGEAFDNERVRHIKAILKVGGYPAAEVAAAEARRAEDRSHAPAGRAPNGNSFKPPREHKSSPPKEPNAYNGDVTSPAFLQSGEWRKLRMEALKLHGARCQCCGASRADGVVMNVDHIKPRKHFPELALDIDNLQVLCNVCNHGKGNWDMTSWKNKK